MRRLSLTADELQPGVRIRRILYTDFFYLLDNCDIIIYQYV